MVRPIENVIVSLGATASAAMFGVAETPLPGAEYLGFGGILLLVLFWQQKNYSEREAATRATTDALIAITRAQAEATSGVQRSLEHLAAQQHQICVTLRDLIHTLGVPTPASVAHLEESADAAIVRKL